MDWEMVVGVLFVSVDNFWFLLCSGKVMWVCWYGF